MAVMVVRVISVVMPMMVITIVMMIVTMMVAVPSCSWSRAADCDCADHT